MNTSYLLLLIVRHAIDRGELPRLREMALIHWPDLLDQRCVDLVTDYPLDELKALCQLQPFATVELTDNSLKQLEDLIQRNETIDTIFSYFYLSLTGHALKH